MTPLLRMVIGMPRSGTSWIAQILDSSPAVRFRLSPMFSWDFKDALREDSTREDWLRVMHGAYSSSNEFMDQTERRRTGEYPTFAEKQTQPPILLVKFNRFQQLVEGMLGLLPEVKVVAVVRNPCGAIHSWLTAPKEFPPEADPLVHWRSGAVKKTGYGDFFGFDDWLWTTRLYERLRLSHPERFCLVRYERVVADPLALAREMCAFLDIPWHAQIEAFLQASHSRHDPGPYSVFKSPTVAERWKSELHPQIRRAIEDELTGTDLEKYLR